MSTRRCTCYVLPHADDCEVIVGITQSGERVIERRSGIDRRAPLAATEDAWVWWNKGDGYAVGPRDKGAVAIVFTIDEAQGICSAFRALSQMTPNKNSAPEAAE
jgi:hypothetical protein